MRIGNLISIIFLAALLLLGACTEVTEFVENLPPETTLMVDSSVNVDPPPARLCSSMRAPIRRASSRLMVRPSPVPP